ncbi:hypothetical protein PM082_019536 [Marasmius tenuissimus]|nr:hypothetical protein PM082_019536 [Marasmius tenuissimus]
MSLPKTTREWYYGKKSGSYRDDLSLQASPLPASIKSSDVLVKIRAVSLQVRTRTNSMAQHASPND